MESVFSEGHMQTALRVSSTGHRTWPSVVSVKEGFPEDVMCELLKRRWVSFTSDGVKAHHTPLPQSSHVLHGAHTGGRIAVHWLVSSPPNLLTGAPPALTSLPR